MTRTAFLLGVYRCFVFRLSLLLFFVVILSAYTSNSSSKFLRTKELSNAEKVLNWINAQQANAKTELHKNKYESLKNNININELWVEDIREGEKIILIPINNGFEIKHNKNKPVTNYLFLILNHKDEVYVGQILQYLSQNGNIKTELPHNTFNKLYLLEPVNGQFTYVDILNTDHYLRELEHRNNKQYRSTVVDPRPRNDNARNPGDITCITTDWYEWTLITFPDGTSYYSETFSHSTTDCTIDGTGGGGGSGGGSSGVGLPPIDDDAPYSRTANMVWRVGHGTVGTHYWRVLSDELLNGIKPRNPTKIATFTTVSHVSTILDAPSGVGSWTQLSRMLNITNDSTVTATNSGTVHFTGNFLDKDLNNLQIFRSQLIWPN